MSGATPVRLRLRISYDGTDFAGWARQRNQRTVCETLTEALDMVLRTSVDLTVAGRTDAGVHATGQVAHLDVDPMVWHDFAPSLLRRLAGVLPPDVRVHEVTEVSPDFDARFAALRRHYRYRICDEPGGGSPLRRNDTLNWPRRLDVSAINEAANMLLGEHDFAAFCRRRPGATTVRCLEALHCEVREDDTLSGNGASRVLVTHVTADAFCHSMVRSLMGALLAVGEGRKPSSWPRELLGTTSRASSVTVAPAHGLTLVQVDYPPDDQLADRTLITRRLRVSSPSPSDGSGSPSVAE